MINFSFLNSHFDYIASEGLFDFNLTLFFIIFQFLVLMLILDSFLYKPLLSIIDKRNNYINDTLKKEYKINCEIIKLNSQYEQELKNIKQKTKLDIEKIQVVYKKLFKIEINFLKKSIDKLFNNIISDLLMKKKIKLKKLDPIIQTLYHEIESKLFV